VTGDIVITLNIDLIDPNPGQARSLFDPEALEELAASIREHGVINPVIVESKGDGRYGLVAGERRLRASRIAGRTEIPAIVRDYTEQKRAAVSLIENIQRADLNPIEEAAAYKSLMALSGLSQEEAAAMVGKNRATVANTLRLLKLPDAMQESLREGALSPGHGRAILSVNGAAARDALYREIVARSLSVREAEKRAAALNEGHAAKAGGQAAPGPDKKPPRAPELDAMEEKFMHHLGTKTVISGTLDKGTITIDYYSMEDLDRLYGLLGG
jgi:ParB family chromosome partitioning protein